MKKKYILVESESITDLNDSVTEQLNEGWVLHGAPVVSVGVEGSTWYYQALTKEEKKVKNEDN